MTKSHLAAWPLAWAPCIADGRARPSHAHGFDWTALELRLQGGVLTIYVVYLTNSIGVTGVNVEKIGQVLDSYRLIQGPVCMIGDWNMPPEVLLTAHLFDLGSSKRLTALQADAPFTCSLGRGSTLDYMLVNEQARTLLTKPVVDEEAPWRPHASWSLASRCPPKTSMCASLIDRGSRRMHHQSTLVRSFHAVGMRRLSMRMRPRNRPCPSFPVGSPKRHRCSRASYRSRLPWTMVLVSSTSGVHLISG